MFKKSKRPIQQRQRARENDSDEEDACKQEPQADENTDRNKDDSMPSLIKTLDEDRPSNDDQDSSDFIRQKDMLTSTKGSAKLSFHQDDEEDNDIFVVKKSAYSRRMERNKKKMLRSVDRNITEINGNNSSTKESVPVKDTEKDLNSKDQQENNTDEMILCPGSDAEDDHEGDFSENEKKLARGLPQFRNVLERGVIPDAKMIYELKKQRQKLARTTNEDFIPLEENDEAAMSESSKSRILREDDDDKSEDAEDDAGDDEDGERIQFGKVDYKTKERDKAREVFRLAQEEINADLDSKQKRTSSSNEDSSCEDNDEQRTGDSEDEVDRWEREQIRKAFCLPALYQHSEIEFQQLILGDKKLPATSNAVSAVNRFSEDNHNVIPIEVDNQIRFGSHIPVHISESNNRAQNESNFQPIDERRAFFRRKLEASLEDHKQLLDRVAMDLKITSQNIGEFNTKKSTAEQDSIFYKNMLEFVQNLCGCIDDKLELIETCEKLMINWLESRATKRREQYRSELQDQNTLCVQLIINHKTNCSQFYTRTGISIFDLYDFAGDNERRHRLIRREARQRKLTLQQIIDGASSDEEEDDGRAVELSKYSDMPKEVDKKIAEIFDDTDSAYASLREVITQFETWKKTRSSTYRESFIRQFIPKFSRYYIRYDLLRWNVLHDPNATKSFVQIPGVADLIRLCKSYDDADLDLVPEAFDITIFPHICTLFDKQLWNPLSTRQTARLVRLLTAVLSTCPSLVDSCDSLTQLLKRIVTQIESSIENDIFIPQMIPSDFFLRNIARSNFESQVVEYVTNFFRHQFWAAMKLFRNIISFRHLIGEPILKELALDRLLNRYLLMSISRCAADSETVLIQATQLIAVIPEDWRRSLTTHPVIIKLADLIQRLEKQYEKSDDDVKRKLTQLARQISR